MRTVYATLEELGHQSSLDVAIYYKATPGERRVDYYPDGSGYPGSPPDAELVGVRVTRWDVGNERRPRDKSAVWPFLDRIAEDRIQSDWDNYRAACLRDAAESEEQ